MEERRPNAFAETPLDHNLKLALARELEQMYASLVAEPVPSHLRDFIERLDRALKKRR